MLGRSRVLVVCGISVLAMPAMAAAQEAAEPVSETTGSDAETSAPPESKPVPSEPARAAAADEQSAESGSSSRALKAPEAPVPANESEHPGLFDDWHIEVHGYFRAPMALGFSSRPNPDTPDGPAKGQISYAPNRTIDGSYYSFAYTRLQETDWAELTFHAKKKHVDAAVGWMGYW
ncbi:MAG TPA: hypothetical protein VHM25_14405, partial [Polyangiaceae bacterium]|nr:hypothetical protein [Polyangiaceae bacterium]